MSNDEDIWLHALMIGFIPPVVGMIIIDLLVYNMGSGETNVSLLCFPVCWVLAFFYVSNHYNKKAELARKNTERARIWESGSAERARKEERGRAEWARMQREQERIQREQAENEAYAREEDLNYAGAIRIWERLGNRSEAKRIRLKMREDGKVKVDQTVVQGDYVDDRDTTVKDSVLNRSNVGAGGKTKGERIKLIKELLDSGAIDKDDYEKMKREIIG